MGAAAGCTAVEAKLAPPRVSSAIVRPDQIDKLAEAAVRRVAIVCAPAGYGKTTVVAEACRRLGWTAVWYRCDALDRIPDLVVATLVAGVRSRWPGFGETLVEDMADDGPALDAETVVGRFVSDLSRTVDSELHLIIDDLDQSPAGAYLESFLELLVANLPAHVHLVVLGRQWPTIPLARLRLSGQLTEIRSVDLCLDGTQVKDIFALRTGYRLSALEAAQLHELTEGWPAGVELAASVVSEGDLGSLTEGLSRPRVRTAFFEYLAQEVFDRQSPDVRSFLKRTCCLNYISAEVGCRLVHGDDAEAILEGLARRGSFTWASTDGDTYRYHHLFREYLRARVTHDDGAAALEGLMLETAAALEACGDFASAVELLVQAGCPAKVVEVFVRAGFDALGACSTDLMRITADRLALGSCSEAAVRLIRAVIAFRVGDLRGAESLASAVAESLPQDEDNDLRNLALEVALQTTFYCGDHQAVVELCRRLLASAPGSPHRGHILFRQAFSLAGLGMWDKAAAVVRAGRADPGIAPSGAAMLEGLEMTLREMRGDYRAALVAGRQALPTVMQKAPASTRASYLSALAGIELASGNYERSETHLARSREICDQFNLGGLLSDHVSAMLLIAEGRSSKGLTLFGDCLAAPALADDLETQAQLQVAVGKAWRRLARLSKAEQCFRTALSLLEDRTSPECRLDATANVAFVRGKQDHDHDRAATSLFETSARAAALGFGFVASEAEFLGLSLLFQTRWPRLVPTGLSACVARQLELGHIDFLSQEFGSEPALLNEFLRNEARVDICAGVMDAMARHWNGVQLLASAARLGGDLAAAALDAGARHLTDDALETLLGRMAGHQSSAVRAKTAAVRRARGLSQSQRERRLPELTARECQVLALVAAGKRDRDIAVRLSVSSATVKTHVHRILSKLEVESRMQAGLLFRERLSNRTGPIR